MTLRTGVAGWPIAHSLSPLIHGAWIAAARLDASYEAFGPRDAAEFARLLDQGRAGSLRGLNVTAPYKEQALAAADAASDTARQAGSANLLQFEGGKILADSTDGHGLMAALAEQAPGLKLQGTRTVILGAGGAARAAVAALMEAGASVSVLNRTAVRAEGLARALGCDVAEPDDLKRARLLVNALSVPPEVDLAQLGEGAVVMDMTYRPLATPFLTQARRRGLVGVDGLAMLIGQARPSFETLFGQAVPDFDVRGLALAHLRTTA